MSSCCYKFSHPQFIDTGIYYSITISTTLIYSTITFTRGLLLLTTIAPSCDPTSFLVKISFPHSFGLSSVFQAR